MPIVDISIPLGNGLAVWPGDAPFRLERSCSMQHGASVNLGELSMSLHTGTHVDAPWHTEPEGPSIDAVALEPFAGPAVVIDVRGRNPIRPGDLPLEIVRRVPRILLRTSAWPDPTCFPESIPLLDPALPDLLSCAGAMLLGVDLPSVDPLDSVELPFHHALAARGIRILEGLRLDDAPDGVCDLFALPLRIVGGDGSPVRAVLRV